MKTKQLIERNLSFSDKYIYLKITRGSIESGQVCSCDNCGTLITNMVTVASNTTGIKYTIGTDCAETLSKAKCLYNNGTASDFYVDIYSYNKTARVATELRKGAKVETDGIFVHVLTEKNKRIDCTYNDLKQFFPELINH